MKRKILLASMITCLILAIGQADKGNFIAAAILAIWPVSVGILNLIDSVRRYGW